MDKNNTDNGGQDSDTSHEAETRDKRHSKSDAEARVAKNRSNKEGDKLKSTPVKDNSNVATRIRQTPKKQDAGERKTQIIATTTTVR